MSQLLKLAKSVSAASSSIPPRAKQILSYWFGDVDGWCLLLSMSFALEDLVGRHS